MIGTIDDFSKFAVDEPSLEGLQAEHAALHHELDAAKTTAQRLAVIARWDALRRRVDTWSHVTTLRFEQDTRNEQFAGAKSRHDELAPQITALDVAMKRKLLAHADRPNLEAALGGHAFKLWESDVLAFEPIIQADLTTESKIGDEYTALIASAKLNFAQKTLNLAGLAPYQQDPDREVRYRAQQVRWSFFGAHKTELDEIFDRLVKLRHGMARKLGYAAFMPLGYKRMNRVDFGEPEVARFRDEIVREVVPLAAAICERRVKKLGIDALKYWDEPVADPRGNPRPLGDHDWIVARAKEAFSDTDGDLGAFFEMMDARRLLDLQTRDGKAAGGFCTNFPTQSVPFVFANFNGTKGDVEVLVHEIGHAYQNWNARNQPLFDYLWPTAESAEIDSIGMEHLMHQQMDRFFGADGERFRAEHLADEFLRLPYMAAVDHFQHLVYAQPDAAPAERNKMWQQMERRYLPWRDYGDLEHPAQGGFWQSQLHIYRLPFYYVDYALAACCALQFWAASQRDFPATFERYRELCRRGGSAAFGELVRSANLRSPFEAGALREIVSEASSAINL